MSKKQPFSREQQNRVLEALDKVAAMLDDGSSAMDAVVKVANDMQLNSNLVERLCHAYNTGTQENQRLTNDNVLDKFAAFEVVPADVVIEKVFNGEETKQASAVPSSPSLDLDRITPGSLFQKVAAAELKAKKTPTLLTHAQERMLKYAEALENGQQLTPQQLADAQQYSDEQYGYMLADARYTEQQRRKLAADYTDKLQRAKRLAKQAAYEARERLSATVATLCNRFNELPIGKNPEQIKFNAAQRFGMDKVACVFEALVNPYLKVERKPRVKLAEYKPDPLDVEPVNWRDPLYALIKQAVDQLDEAFELKTAHEVVQNYADRQLQVLHEIYPTVDGELLKRQRMAKLAEIVKEAEAAAEVLEEFNFFPDEKTASVSAIALGGTISSALQNQLGLRDAKQDKRITSNIDKLMAPDLDLKKRQARAEFLVNDMMDSDPIIGSYDPNLVLQYYNEISEIAPNAALKAGIIRPALRRALQGNQEMFEGKALLDTDKMIRDRRGYSSDRE